MKTLIIALLGLFLFMPNKSKAQFSIGANMGLSNIELILFSAGTDLSAKYQFENKLRLGVSAGYYIDAYDLWYEELFSDKYQLETMPLNVSVEYSLGKNRFRPYVGAQLGLTNIRTGYSDINKFFSTGLVFGFDQELTKRLFLNLNFKGDNVFERYDTLGLNYMFYFNLGLSYKFIGLPL